MSEEQIRILELSIEQAKEKTYLLQSLKRLKYNKDFIEVILKGYFEDEAIRLVHAKGNPGCADEESQKSIITQMDAIGSLSSYFRTIMYTGQMAEKAINDDQRTKEELLVEEISA